jgi:two-component system, NtrC family, response regulator AtoC
LQIPSSESFFRKRFTSTVNENTTEFMRLLVVSREGTLLRLLGSLRDSNSWQGETASNGWHAMERVQSGTAPRLLLLDIPDGDTDSLHFLRWLRRLRPDIPVVAICHPEDVSRGDEASRLGAESVVMRPFNPEQLRSTIQRYFETPASRVAEAVNGAMEIGQDAFFFSSSLAMEKLRAQAELLAQTDVPVLIVGEKGCGKNAVASLIHKLSVRSGFKLVKVDCSIPPALLEAEIFGNGNGNGNGHGHGGSNRKRRMSLGRFSAGEKGSIFLNEISDMPLELQGRLLQELRNGEGAGDDGVAAEVRILAASSANLDRALLEKRLRQDLYYRLSAFTIHVPPLRQRKDEIPLLLRYFMHKLAKHYRMPAREFSSAVLEACERHPWPGNLKELETFVKRYLVAGDCQLPSTDARFGMAEFRTEFGANLETTTSGPKPAVAFAENDESRTARSKPESLKSLIQGIKSEAERNAIGAALKRTGWNRKEAARLLSVSYRTLLYKIEQYQMRAPEHYLTPSLADFSLYGEDKDDGEVN